MAGMIRNLAAIGLIAYFSPVHEQPPAERLDALRSAPAQVAQDLARGVAQGVALEGPRLAAEAVRTLDPASRDRLALLIANVVAGEPAPPAPRPPGRVPQ